MEPATDVKPGDKFVLTGLPGGWVVPAYLTKSRSNLVLVDDDIVVAGDPAIAIGGLWVTEPRLDGFTYMRWEYLSPVGEPEEFPPCRCNIMVGPCRCGAFQREMARS